jgi:hypothetical protein
VTPLREYVLLAGAASLLLNLALLMPSIYTMQVLLIRSISTMEPKRELRERSPSTDHLVRMQARTCCRVKLRPFRNTSRSGTE